MQRAGDKSFQVLFTDGSKKDIVGDSPTTVFFRMARFIVCLRKNYNVEAIIDEAEGKLYTNFDLSVKFDTHDKHYEYLLQDQYSKADVEALLMDYVKYTNGSEELAMRYFNDKTKKLSK